MNMYSSQIIRINYCSFKHIYIRDVVIMDMIRNTVNNMHACDRQDQRLRQAMFTSVANPRGALFVTLLGSPISRSQGD